MNATGFRRPAGARPFVLGHRGVRGTAPENTMAAFELAARSGADGVELDVRLCRSGELAVCHDPTLTRATSQRDTRRVADLDAAELAKVDVGGGQGVPLLRDVLAWADGARRTVNVEMKRDVPGRRALVAATAQLLRERTGNSPVIVSSFDPWMLGYLGWLLPGVPRGFLFEPKRTYLRNGWPATLLGAAAVHPERTLCRPEQVAKWRARGKVINVWTVNDPSEARTLADLGVDAIITDKPDLILAAIS
ncbi:MAG TPA: glycerophosphodiester phosphodiesterase [Polyangiaceae bacterium]